MRTLLLAIVLMASVPAFAQDTPASEASIRELLDATNGKAVLEAAWNQLDGVMEKAMKDAIGDKPVTEKQEKVMAAMRAETVAMIRQEMTWESLEPLYIHMYSTTFTQSELDGMLNFYKSDAGKAVTAKLPQMVQVLMQDVMASMQGMLPKLHAITAKYVEQLKDAK
jgi:hypothetical protein